MKKKLSIFIRVVLTAIMLFFLFRWVNPGKISGILRDIKLGYLFISGLLFLFIYILCFLRWFFLLKSIGIQPPQRKLFISYCGGIFFNLFLPSTVGGDVIRVIDLTNHLKRTKEIAASVFVDRFSGFVALALTALVAIFIGRAYVDIDQREIVPLLILFTLLFFAILFLFTKTIFFHFKKIIPSDGLRKKIENLHTEIFYFRKQPKALLFALSFSLLVQAFYIIGYYFIFLALNIQIGIVYLFIYLPLITALAMIPISVGGLGVRDMGSVYFFAKVGIAKDAAVASSLLNFFFLAIAGGLCGLIYVFAFSNRRLQRH